MSLFRKISRTVNSGIARAESGAQRFATQAAHAAEHPGQAASNILKKIGIKKDVTSGIASLRSGGMAVNRLFKTGKVGDQKLFGTGSVGSKTLHNISHGLASAGHAVANAGNDINGWANNPLVSAGIGTNPLGSMALSGARILGGALSGGGSLLGSGANLAKQRNWAKH